MKGKRILLFGYLATVEFKFNGQTIRTNNLKRLLENLDYDVKYYDTQRLPINPFTIIPALAEIGKSDMVFLLPAHRGVKILLPLIVSVSYLFRKRIFYVAIGGWLPSFIKKYRYLRFFLRKVSVVFVQSKVIAEGIQDSVVPAKVEILPNFKYYNFNREINSKDNSKPLKVVFISRVGKEKGLDTVKHILDRIENENQPICIDLYGPIAPNDAEYLDDMIKKYSNVEYKGIVEQDSIFTTLARYDVMLFPTHHMTEGFPGVILDAYIAGLPIVASNWNSSAEFVKPEFGLIFNHDNPDEAFSHLVTLLNDRDLLARMQFEAYKYREFYSPSSIAAQIQMHLL